MYSLLERSGVYSALMRVVSGGDHFMRHLVQDWFQIPAHGSVLDIGCGPGPLLKYLEDTVFFVGVDPNVKYIETARRQFLHRPKEKTQLLVGGVDDFPPVTEHAFDRVIALGVLHHLSDPQADRLFEIAKRALKPGGQLITVDGCFTTPQNPIERYIVSLDRGEYVRTTEAYAQFPRRHEFDFQSAEYHGQILIPYAHWVMKCTKP